MQNLQLSPADISRIAAQVAAIQAGANAAPQPGPKPARDLPRNIDGNPEFSNVILTLDHLQDAYGDDGHIRNKMVFSTESVAEVIAKLISYYQVSLTPNVLARILEITGKAAETEYNGGILVCYFEDGNPNEGGFDHGHPNRGPVVEIVMSTVTYDGLVRHPDFGKDSSLLASSALVSAVGAALERQKERGGFYPTLTFLQITEADFPAADAVEVRPADLGDLGANTTVEPAASDAPNSTTGGQAFAG